VATPKQQPRQAITLGGAAFTMEHETKFERAFPSRSATSHTRHSLIARDSPFRWQRVAIVEFTESWFAE
jgi:hypothetical protein